MLMSDEQIIQAALDPFGIHEGEDDLMEDAYGNTTYRARYIIFAHAIEAAARAEERERCAEVIRMLVLPRKQDDARDPEDELFYEFCAAGEKAIRALGSSHADE